MLKGPLDDVVTSRASSVAVEGELRTAIQRIRGALTDLFASVNVDPYAPREVARAVGINRNLAWKLSKILGAEEPLATVDHLPGGPGLDIMLAAFDDYGAPPPATQQVREAMQAFERAVEVHVGDRDTLALMLGHMLPPHLQIERAEAARKLAFRGNSAIWGIQAEVRLAAMFLAPSAGDVTMVDIVNLGGLFGYRRLRSGTTWPLLRQHGFGDDGVALGASSEPLDPVPGGGAPLLRAFCKGAQPEIVAKRAPGGVQFELGEGPLGNQGLLTSVFATVFRRFASCYRDETNERGEMLVDWFTPVVTAVSDLIVHRGLPFSMPPTLDVYGRMRPSWGSTGTMREGERLELPETIRHLGDGPPVLSTPIVPSYGAMSDYVFQRLGWDPRDFSAWRVVVRYPPIPSMAFLGFALAQRPASA